MEPAFPLRIASRLPVIAFSRIDPFACERAQDTIDVRPADVHVWAFIIEEPREVVDAWRRVLSDDERRRADRFVHESDRRRWTVARGGLRYLLSRYCDTPPGALAFEQGAAGKPSLTAAAHRHRTIHFNLAHSHGRALLAVGGTRPVGIDLEQARGDFDTIALARHYFCERELEAITAAPVLHQREAFFRHWVAKESVLKAQGVGLSFPLDRFFVTFDADDAFARVQSRDPSRLDPDWFIRLLAAEEGWHAAVTARGEDWDVRVMA
jgi:4'-phosphopantetheinyl transferase